MQSPKSSACCCQLLLQRYEGSSEGQGLHGSWTRRKEFCLNLPQGYRDQDRKIVYKSQFSCRSGVVSSAGCLSYILLFYDESASNVSQRCDLYWARHCSTFFVKIIALGHVFMYWPVSPHLMMEVHHTRHLEGDNLPQTIIHTSAEFVLLPQTTMQQMFRQKLCRTPLPHIPAQHSPQNTHSSLGKTQI